jgi:polyisoprenoid-binding protein YceI
MFPGIRGEERRTTDTASTARSHAPVPLAVATPAPAATGHALETARDVSRAHHTWRFDTVHSSIHFSVRRMLVGRVAGEFTKWRGTMAFDPAQPEASHLDVRIDAGSIDTGEVERDAHLRSPDFLHADAHPVLTFQSLRVDVVEEGRFAVTGLLQIRGVTREVVLHATYRGTTRDPWGNDHLTFDASTRIERGAFGLKWNQVMPTGELFVGESVEITLAIEATRLPVNVA